MNVSDTIKTAKRNKAIAQCDLELLSRVLNSGQASESDEQLISGLADEIDEGLITIST